MLLAHSARNRLAILIIVLALLLESAFGALIAVAFGHIIDVTIPRHDRHDLVLVLAIIGAGALLISLIGVLRDYLYASVQSDLLRTLREAMFERLQRVSLDYFGRTGAGDILARFSGDLATLDGALGGAAPWVLLPACDVAIGTATLFWLDWRLALPAMLIWPACLAGPRLFGRRATSAADDRKDHEAHALAAVHENIAAQPTIRLFLVSRQFVQRFVERAERLASSSRRLGFESAMVERSAGIGINVLRVVILGVGAVMALTGGITLGKLASFQAVFLVMSSGLSWISQYAPTLLQAGGSLRRVQQLLEEEADPSTADESLPAMPPLQRGIALDTVRFRYPTGRVAVRDVTLSVARGSRVAIVGSSGSGKSTLLSLLLRLADPTVGTIRVDDRDVRLYSVASVRQRLAVVSQDSFLFAASLADNIRIGRPDASMDDVMAAARAAEIHDFILSLPNGYDTRVEEGGVRLSGGQRQRVAIARALVRRPDILVLDEATSALDAVTESAVNTTLRAMAAGKTVISVTHRLSSVADADRIFVMSGGAIVEEGTHRELLARRGTYHTLWQKQHGFIAGADARIEVTPERLRRIPLLSALDDTLLEELAQQFVVDRQPPDTVLVHEGDVADKFYVLVRGRVAVTRAGPDGEPVDLATLDDGDYFGEIGLLHDVPRSASVRTLTECSCLVLDREGFRRIVARVPRLRDELLERVSARLAVTPTSAGYAVAR